MRHILVRQLPLYCPPACPRLRVPSLTLPISPETPAPDTALEAVYLGANQLAWGTTGHTPLVRAIATLSFRSSLATWGADKLREARIVTLDVFTKMKPFEREDYARLAGRGGNTRRMPVALVYGTADVAYPEHTYKAFAREMEEEGVKLDVFTLEDAPHFLSATHFEEYVSSDALPCPHEPDFTFLRTQAEFPR